MPSNPPFRFRKGRSRHASKDEPSGIFGAGRVAAHTERDAQRLESGPQPLIGARAHGEDDGVQPVHVFGLPLTLERDAFRRHGGHFRIGELVQGRSLFEGVKQADARVLRQINGNAVPPLDFV